MSTAELFYTLPEAAARLRRSQKSVTRLIASAQLTRDPTSYRILIPVNDVDSFTARRGRRIAPAVK